MLRPLLQRHLPLCVAPLSPRRRWSPLCLPSVAAAAGRMESNRPSEEPQENPGTNNPKIARIQSLLTEDSKGGWEKCWEEGLTPWDLGRPTPVVLHLLQTGELPKGRTLVPGCGSGHDVVAMACPERYVVGLDISESAVKIAHEGNSISINWNGKSEWNLNLRENTVQIQMTSNTLPNKNCFTFLAEDFFTWRPAELFDLIFDYTFFCAIDPCMRSAWAKQIHDILKPDGELITLMFPVGDYVGGPPYAVSVDDYKEVLIPVGFQTVSIIDNELAIEPRKGREKLGRWRQNLTKSLM